MKKKVYVAAFDDNIDPLPAYEYEQAEETDEILLACNLAIQADPANPDHWIQKSQRLGELQRYDEAMICQDEAMKLLKFYTN